MAKMTHFERVQKARNSMMTYDGFICEQDRREGPLVEFIRKIVDPKVCLFPSKAADEARNILAAYGALDAKPEPFSPQVLDLSSRLVGRSFTPEEAAMLTKEISMRTHTPKPEPTLAECERRLRDLWAAAQSNRIDGPLSDALDAWKAAVEREERCAGERKGK